MKKGQEGLDVNFEKLNKLSTVLSRIDKLDNAFKSEILPLLNLDDFPGVDESLEDKLGDLENKERDLKNKERKEKWRDIILNLKHDLSAGTHHISDFVPSTLKLAKRHWIDYQDVDVAKKVIKHWLENENRYEVWQLLFHYMPYHSSNLASNAVLKIKKEDLNKFGLLTYIGPNESQSITDEMSDFEGEELIIWWANWSAGYRWRKSEDDFKNEYEWVTIVDIT